MVDGKTTLINFDNKRIWRDLVRHGNIATTAIQVTAPFFQNDDGVVDQGGAVTNRATGLVLDVSAVNFTRASGTKSSKPKGTATVGTANALDPRIDTVVLDTTTTDATYIVIAGTATAGATLFNLQGKGTVPANRIVLAYVLVPATATNLAASSLADARP